jgi:hypothetical protein
MSRRESGHTGYLNGVGDPVSFELRLGQTIAWCLPRARASDPAGSLRSEQLRPRVLEADRAAIVRRVAQARMNGVRDAQAVNGGQDLLGGRLLAYFPDAELSDGAAEIESRGFFDVNNAPPWDTWIALFRDDSADVSSRDCLVSWVAEELIETVDRGIGVNPEQCIVWLSDARIPIAERLRARRLRR